jgi:hypothetical protein
MRGLTSAATRFTGSLHDIWVAHWDDKPTPNPSEEGSRRSFAEQQFPSWEGPGVGRFTERGLSSTALEEANGR